MNYKIWIVAAVALVIIYGAYCVYLFWSAAQKSAPLVEAAQPFNREDPSYSQSILVLGDSLAVGVGAPANKTIAARLADVMHANVANFGKSGAHTSDLMQQMALAQKSHYDLILMHMGANDIIQLMSISAAALNMDRALEKAKEKSDHVVFLFAGNIGDAPLWPWPFKSIYKSKSLDLRARYAQLALKHDALFIDIYAKGPVFESDPKRYYAPDNLHLSADGYEKWFEFITESVQEKWPALLR